jgi:glycosyltransferase involved in cell wall biosynthesis
MDIEHLQSTFPGERREDNLLLAVSRLESYKRVDLAIETLAALPQHYRLVIVGHGPLRRRLAELASSRGVSGRTVFLGSVGDDDLMRWYRRASVLLNLSEAEAFGLTVLESIAAGCRAVCSAIPAFRELEATFPDHIAVTSAPDPRAVAATVMSFSRKPMVSSPDLARFSWSAAVDQLLALYQELLEPHPGHPLPTAHNRVRQKEGMRP